MLKLEEIERLLVKCVEAAILELPLEQQFVAASETLLLAEGSPIDSLQLVSIVVDFEESINREYGTSISLTSDEAMMRAESPFYSVRTLSNFALTVLMDTSRQ